jgi:phosphoribosyl 1,2-cyclic phosphate phosphodiesterase
MKIKFLGTSAGWPLPRLGCKCQICTSKDQKDTRTRSQALINDVLILDVGPDTYQHLRSPDLDPTLVQAAAITHEHSDHTFGLWDFSHIYTNKGRVKPKIFINPKTLAKIRFMFFPNEYEIVKIETIKIQEDAIISFENLSLTFLAVNHTDSTFGILVREGDKRFFWAPDFKSLPAETIAKAKGADLVAIDGSELKIKTPSHETIEEGILLGKALQAKQVYFVHLGHRTLPHKDLESYVKKKGGSNFHIAYDGLEIEI